MATKNKTKSETKKTTRGRWRPPKNTVWKKKKSGRWRPPKNVIQPRKSKQTTTKKTTKKIKNKVKNKIKSKVKNKTIKKTGFFAHKVEKKEEKTSNFALILLIFSFLLFLFSLYKAFYQYPIETKNKSETQQTMEPLYLENTITEETEQTWLTNWNTWEDTEGNTENDTVNNIVTNIIKDIEEKEETKKTFPYIIWNIQFDKAFVRKDKNETIKSLQKLLTNENFYSWNINGEYTKETINAVYKFQTQNKIIKTNTPKTAFGYLGPSTRKHLNKLISKYNNN